MAASGRIPSRHSEASASVPPPPPTFENESHDGDAPPPPPTDPFPPQPNPSPRPHGGSSMQQPTWPVSSPRGSFDLPPPLAMSHGEYSPPTPESNSPQSVHQGALHSLESRASRFSQLGGDAAGGTALPREAMEPVRIGKGADGAGVGMVDDTSVLPPDAELLDVVTSFIGFEATAVIQDGFGCSISLEPGHEKSFEVHIGSEGVIEWKSDNGRESLQPPEKTNWIVAASDAGEVSWHCYVRTFGLPAGSVYLGHETAVLKESGTVVVWNGSGDNISIPCGEDKTFAVKLDAQGYFRWTCDATEERTRAPSSDVSWIRALHPFGGREITWRYYSIPLMIRDVTSPPKAQLGANESENTGKDQGFSSKWRALWRRGDPAEKDSEQDPASITRRDQEDSRDWPVHKTGSSFALTCIDFPLCNIHCPCFFATVVLVCICSVIGLAWPGMEVETDFDSFLEADSRANEVRVAFMDALGARGHGSRRLSTLRSTERELESAGNPAAGYWALDPNILHKIYQLEIMYRAREPGNLISLRTLREIRKFEAKLTAGPLWHKLCRELVNQNLRSLCEPGASLTNLVWPENMDEQAQFHMQETVHYNISGLGREPLPLEASLQVAESMNLRTAFFPAHYAGSGVSDALRTLYEFDLVVCTVSDTMAFRKGQLAELSEVYDNFVSGELFPLLQEQSQDEEATFTINWKGDSLDSYEAWDTLMSDAMLAFGSVTFIFSYLTFHTKSPLISAGALLLSMLSIPTAFVTSARLSGGNRVTGASFLSLFLIVGLGADVVLVFVSFFELSREKFGNDYANRVLWVYKHAGIACLATSMTTAASFFANLASVLKPLREFGFFMGLCIMDVYFLVLVGLPPLLIINEKLGNTLAERGYCGGVPSILRRPRLPTDDGQTDWSRASTADLEERAHQKTFLQKVITRYFDQVLMRFRRRLLGAFTLLPIIFFIWTLSVVNVDGGMPAMFPDDHNQNAGKILAAKFSPIEEIWVEPSFFICNIGRMGPSHIHMWTNQICALTWCHLGVGGPLVTEGFIGENDAECRCVPAREKLTESTCWSSRDELNLRTVARVGATVRFVGLSHVPDSFWQSDEWTAYLREATNRANGAILTYDEITTDPQTFLNLSMMVQEHWETGMIRVTPYKLGPDVKITVPVESDESPLHAGKYCAANTICYCGAPACKFRDESLIGPGPGQSNWVPLKIPGGGRRLQGKQPTLSDLGVGTRAQELVTGVQAQHAKRRLLMVSDTGAISRRLSPHPYGRRLSRPASDQIDVTLLWGLVVEGGAPLLGKPSEKPWKFDYDFRPDSPRAQRHLHRACLELKQDPELYVQSHICWVAEFRRWLRGQNELWPTRATRFASLLAGFQQIGLLTSGTSVTDFMWFGYDGSLRATYISFAVAMSYSATPSSAALRYMKKWDDATQLLNDEAPIDASNCWHTSRLWIRAEAEKAIVDSTVNTLMVSIGCGFLGTLCFTLDALLSAFVVCAVAGVTACLAFFMCVIMGWPFGAVEVLGLIVFVGYSITYSLHIAHKYGEHTKALEGTDSIYLRRYKAVSHALHQMSSAVSGSALTTLGSSFFLFFCTMAIFVKLAAVLFAVTFFAGLFALVALPSALLVVGPVGRCGCGSFQAMIRDESFDHDVEEPSSHSHGSEGHFSGHSSSGGPSSGGGPGDSGRAHSPPHSQPTAHHAAATSAAASLRFGHGDGSHAEHGHVSEVFHSGSTPGVTPNSSPGIRSLVAAGAAPGPPIIAMSTWDGLYHHRFGPPPADTTPSTRRTWSPRAPGARSE